jgi:hypothetical protein
MRSEVRRWWGERWLEVLDEAGPAASRHIQRGQALARRGAVEDLAVEPGTIVGSVPEDRARPLRVELAVPLASDEAWEAAIDALAGELRFTAALLEGDLPHDLHAALTDAGVVLFPGRNEIVPTCTCPERARLCRHAVAVHVAAGTLIDRDPTLLLVLRGRGREELLNRVRANRGGDEPGHNVALELSRGLEEAGGDLDRIELHPAPVDDPAGLFRHLGDPPGVDDIRPLVALIERAAAGAWRLAAGDGAAAADEELLLAELRAKRVASAEALAEALGRDVDVVRGELDGLFEVGAVLRTGAGMHARYRASS